MRMSEEMLDEKTLFFNTSDSNNSENDVAWEMYYDAIAFENTVSIVVPTLFGLVIFVGVLGNMLVITVVASNRQMRNSTNMLIVNLAFSDLLFLILCVPFTAADYALPVWVFSSIWCSCLFYLQFVSAYASVWTLVLMAFDRYLAVVFPVQSITLRTVRHTVLVIVALWVIILISNVSQLREYGMFEYEYVFEQRQTCTFVLLANGNATESHVRAHYFVFTVFGYFAPLLVTCILYFFVLQKLWYRMPITRNRMSEESVRAKRKVTWMVTGVIVTFAICWLPLNICFMYTALLYRQYSRPPGSIEFVVIMMASQVLAYANSCANPILYAFLSDNFRKAFKRVWHYIICYRKADLYRRNASYERSEVRCTPTYIEQTTLGNRTRTSSAKELDLILKNCPVNNGETVCLNNGATFVEYDDDELL